MGHKVTPSFPSTFQSSYFQALFFLRDAGKGENGKQGGNGAGYFNQSRMGSLLVITCKAAVCLNKINVIMTPKFCNIGDFVLHIFGHNGLSTGDALKTRTQSLFRFGKITSVPLDYTESPRNRTAFCINAEHYVQRHRWEILYPTSYDTSYNLKSGEPC